MTIKYLFIGASYFLWYYTAWHTASVLVFTIASQLMHGIQYIVIVYWFTRRKAQRSHDLRTVAVRLVSPGNLKLFLVAGLLYAVVYQLIIGNPLQDFGFGFIDFTSNYESVPEVGLGQMSTQTGNDLFAAAVIENCALTHFYFDSFIWKVRDTKTQQGL